MELIRPARLAALLVACSILAPLRAAEPIDVWLDVDTSTGISDVDDGLMLIQCFHSPELRIRGISVVFGNAPLDKAVPIARDIVERFGPADMPVHPGAASSDELGEPNDAVRAMAAALRERPLTILAVGPVTNVGTLLMRHPELHDKIERLVMVAARRPGQRFITNERQPLPHRDFNFELDPAAMQAILDTDIPLVFAPWEVSSHVWISQDDLSTLRESGASGKWIAETSQYWIARWRVYTDLGFNPFDTLAAGWVTHPHLIETMPVRAWIEELPDDRATPEQQAAGAVKPYLLVEPTVEPTESPDREIIYAYRPQPEFQPLLLRRLAGPQPAQ